MPAGAAAGIPAVARRLSSRQASEQADAALELADLLDSPSAQVACLAAGGAPALVQLLHSRNARVQGAASWAVGMLAHENAAGQAALAAAGAIPPLAHLLHASSDDGLLMLAAGALESLATQNAANAAAVLAAGCVPRLLQLLRDSSSDKLHEAAAFVLHKIASSSDSGAAEIVACGGAAPLVLRLGSSSMFLQAAAAAALAGLTRNEPLTAAVVREGALPALVRLLHSSDDAGVLKSLTAALGAILRCSPGSADQLVAAGCIPCFVRQLRLRGMALGN